MAIGLEEGSVIAGRDESPDARDLPLVSRIVSAENLDNLKLPMQCSHVSPSARWLLILVLKPRPVSPKYTLSDLLLSVSCHVMHLFTRCAGDLHCTVKCYKAVI